MCLPLLNNDVAPIDSYPFIKRRTKRHRIFVRFQVNFNITI